MSATFALSGFVAAKNSIDCQPAIGCAYQRASACSIGGYVLTCQPRANPKSVAHSSDGEYEPTPNPQDWTYYMDLQYNQIVTPIPASGDFALDTNISWGLVGPSSSGRTQFLSTMQVLDATAYAFWTETPINASGNPTGGNTLCYFPFGPSAIGPSWNTDDIVTVGNAQLPAAPLVDFASAVVDASLYLFAVTSEQGAGGSFTVSCMSATSEALTAYTAAPSSNASLFAFQSLIEVDGFSTIHSLDAATVLVPNGAGGANARLAVIVGGLGASSDNIAQCWLFNPADLTAAPTVVPIPASLPAASTYRTSFRIGWGSIPYASGGPAMAKSGLVVVYTTGFAPAASQTWNAGGGGHSYVTMIDLASLQAPVGWTQLSPPAVAAALTYPGGICLFPVVIANEGTTPYYILTLMANVGDQLDTYIPPPTLTYLQPYPSYKLTAAGTVTGGTAENSELTGADLTAAVSSWVLLGVITGLPPYPAGAPSVTVSISYAGTQGNSTTLTSQSTINVQGDLSLGPVSLGGSLSNTLSVANNTLQASTVAVTHSLANTAGQGDNGWLVVAQPEYQRVNYTIATWDGNSAGFSMNQLWCNSTAPVISFYSFQLTNPNDTSNTSDEWEKTICQFPAGASGPLATWPASTDVAGWVGYTVPASWNVMPVTSLQAFNVSNGNGATETLTFTTGTSTTVTASNTISVSSKVTMLGVFKLGVDGSLTSRNEVGTNFTNSLTISVGYGAWPDTLEYSSLELQPLLYTATADGAPWMPAQYAQQRPWLLTWTLNDAQKASAPSAAPSTTTSKQAAPTTIW